MTGKRDQSGHDKDDTTHPDTGVTPIQPVGSAKKPAVRSTERAVADYLQAQNRIGQFNDYPYRKHRYITLNFTAILDSLTLLYVHLFRVNWDKFGRAAEKFAVPTNHKDSHTLLAHVYISHWANDLYYSIREATKEVNQLAFIEKYSRETSRHSHTYDKYLVMLMNAIKPTAIKGAIADELYIPILGHNVNIASKTKVFGWESWIQDLTIFQFIVQTFENKKIVSMSSPSDEPMGRPSWLFDWFGKSAYAWFPFEDNYNEIDISVAYILGVACTPKVALADVDEWRYFNAKLDYRKIDVDSYIRVAPRRRYGTAEARGLEAEEVQLPNYYEKDKDKAAKLNAGPLAIKKAADDAEASSSSEDTTEADYVPDSPRVTTRSQAGSEFEKALRVRVSDYIYHIRVIEKMDDATRYAAFKMLLSYQN